MSDCESSGVPIEGRQTFRGAGQENTEPDRWRDGPRGHFRLDPFSRQSHSLTSLIERVPAIEHAEVATFVRSRNLHGRGIGWIDAHLLASAVVADIWLWTADEHLAKLAGELGIAYQPRRS